MKAQMLLMKPVMLIFSGAAHKKICCKPCHTCKRQQMPVITMPQSCWQIPMKRESTIKRHSDGLSHRTGIKPLS